MQATRQAVYAAQRASRPQATASCRRRRSLAVLARAPTALSGRSEAAVLLLVELACIALLLAMVPPNARRSCGLAYLLPWLCPWSIAASAARSSAALAWLAVLGSAHCAGHGRELGAALSLTVATALSVETVWLAPALAVLIAYAPAACDDVAADDAAVAAFDAAAVAAVNTAAVNTTDVDAVDAPAAASAPATEDAATTADGTSDAATEDAPVADVLAAVRLCAVYGVGLCALGVGVMSPPPPIASTSWHAWLHASASNGLTGGSRYVQPRGGLWWYLLALAPEETRTTFGLALQFLPRLCLPPLALALPPAFVAARPWQYDQGDAQRADDALRANDSPLRRRPGLTAATDEACARDSESSTPAPTPPTPTPPTPTPPTPTPPAPPPYLALAISYFVLTATKPHPTVPDTALALALLGSQLDERTLSRCRLLPIAVTVPLMGVLISVPLLAAWLDHRQLNANFFYAATILASGGQLCLAYDVCAAALSASGDEGPAEGGRSPSSEVAGGEQDTSRGRAKAA